MGKITIVTKNGKTFRLKPLEPHNPFKGAFESNEEEPQLEEINLASTCPSDCTVHNHVNADTTCKWKLWAVFGDRHGYWTSCLPADKGTVIPALLEKSGHKFCYNCGKKIVSEDGK